MVSKVCNRHHQGNKLPQGNDERDGQRWTLGGQYEYRLYTDKPE